MLGWVLRYIRISCPIGARNIRVALEMNFELHKELRKVIESIDKHFTIGRGDEVYRLRM